MRASSPSAPGFFAVANASVTAVHIAEVSLLPSIAAVTTVASRAVVPTVSPDVSWPRAARTRSASPPVTAGSSYIVWPPNSAVSRSLAYSLAYSARIAGGSQPRRPSRIRSESSLLIPTARVSTGRKAPKRASALPLISSHPERSSSSASSRVSPFHRRVMVMSRLVSSAQAPNGSPSA